MQEKKTDTSHPWKSGNVATVAAGGICLATRPNGTKAVYRVLSGDIIHIHTENLMHPGVIIFSFAVVCGPFFFAVPGA